MLQESSFILSLHYISGAPNSLIMKKQLLFVSCFTVGIGLGANAQIWNAVQTDLGIWGAPNNTGLAVAPNFGVQAAVFDDGSGMYQIRWIETASATIVDADMNVGDDPDVAYFADASSLVVAYEQGGSIFIDEYSLNTITPVDYSLSGNAGISSGQYPNIDVNSSGNGVLTWEDGGAVWACTFQFPGLAVGPAVAVIDGTQPDIVLLDDNSTVALTFVDPNGSLMIYTLDYGSLLGGSVAFLANHGYDWLGNTAAFPRIASQRNANFGPADDFTVVAQYANSSTFPEVYGIFSTGGTISPSPVLINGAFAGCTSFDPRPVVAYDRSEVHIAWSQSYFGGCSGLFESNPNNEDDVLLVNYDFNGNFLFSSAPGIPGGTFLYEEVNRLQSAFGGISRTSISTEYDGFFSINNVNYTEGLLYNDPGDLFWKARDAAMPTFMNEGISETREANFSLATNPVEQTIQVISEDDAPATFQLLDNAGRIVELTTIAANGNNYAIDISHLSGGIYFLHCSSATSEETLRVLQVTK